MKLDASLIRDKIIKDLLAIPWGLSFRKWSMWVMLLVDTKLMTFISENNLLISNLSKSSGRSFIVCPIPETDDCFLIPRLNDEMLSSELPNFVVNGTTEYSKCHNAALVLSLIQKQYVSKKRQEGDENQGSEESNNDVHTRRLLDFLMEYKSVHGIDRLLQEILEISLSLPNEFQCVGVMHVLLKNLIKVTSAGEDPQSMLIAFCSSSSSESISDEIVIYRGLLMKVALYHGTEFPRLKGMLLASANTENKQSFWISRQVVSMTSPVPDANKLEPRDLAISDKAAVADNVVDKDDDDLDDDVVFQPKGSVTIASSTSAVAPVAIDGDNGVLRTPFTGNSNHDFINQLLRRKFDYDEVMNRPPKTHPTLTTLNAALELLASQLYSSDVHFVMELIQNADDNLYHRNVDPSIHFIFDSTGSVGKGAKNATLMVLNNEIGFAERNVEAICEIGKSTKKNKAGYIGQKGIG